MWDKLACVRSIVSVDEHSDSLVSTGYPEAVNRMAHHPSFGSVMSRLRGNAQADILPTSASMARPSGRIPATSASPTAHSPQAARAWPT